MVPSTELRETFRTHSVPSSALWIQEIECGKAGWGMSGTCQSRDPRGTGGPGHRTRGQHNEEWPSGKAAIVREFGQ